MGAKSATAFLLVRIHIDPFNSWPSPEFMLFLPEPTLGPGNQVNQVNPNPTVASSFPAFVFFLSIASLPSVSAWELIEMLMILDSEPNTPLQ